MVLYPIQKTLRRLERVKGNPFLRYEISTSPNYSVRSFSPYIKRGLSSEKYKLVHIYNITYSNYLL